MSDTAFIYTNFLLALANKEHDLNSDDIRAFLISSAYTPNQDTHDYLDDVIANEIATGGGYTAGGVALTGEALSIDTATNTLKFDATDTSFAGNTNAARHVVLANYTPGTNATRGLIMCITFRDASDTPIDKTITSIIWPSTGIMYATTPAAA